MVTRLLLADDSITIQKVVELVLAEEGFEIKAVNNGEEALQAIADFKPEIILADIEMPRMNGYQLCERVKANPATQGIPVILLAGAFEPVDEELARKVGAADYIIKPFESQDLLNKINEAVRSGSAAQTVVEEPVLAAEAEGLQVEGLQVEGLQAEGLQAEAHGEDLWNADFGVTAEEPAAAEEVAAVSEEDVTAVAEEFKASHGGGGPFEAEINASVEPELNHASAEAVAEAEKVPADLSASIRESVAGAVAGGVAEVVRSLDLKSLVLSSLVPEMKMAIEETIRRSAPEIIEAVVKEVTMGVTSGIKKDIEKIIWETVPDLAESLIRKEIDSIKSQI
jgi:CheY-like chemotaxis protein